MIIASLLSAGSYFYFRAHPPVQQHISFTVQLPTDTTAKPVKVTASRSISKDSTRYWRNKYDSVHAIIAGVDTTQSADSAIADYILPEQAEIEDSTSIDFLTIYPMNPMGSRISHDSTHYKPFHCDTTITLPIQLSGARTYVTVGLCAITGAYLGGPLGAGVGGIFGLFLDDWL